MPVETHREMNSAVVPVPVDDVQGDSRWMSLHNLYVCKAKEREPEVLFIGDSIIQQLANYDIWTKMFVPLHCLNFGIGGDETQHVLWRIQNGELDNIAPKVIVLLVGTNNHKHTAEQVVEGILEIVKTMNEKQPQAQIVVSGIPPKGRRPNKYREVIAKINSHLSEKLPTFPNTHFYDVNPHWFVDRETGDISFYDMWDFLHLTEEGYEKLFGPLRAYLDKLLGGQ